MDHMGVDPQRDGRVGMPEPGCYYRGQRYPCRCSHRCPSCSQVADFWRGTPDGLVFTSGWGDALYPDTLTTLMIKIVEAHNARAGAAPLPHARLHDLRHIHATTLLLAGVPVHVVAARLGHADPSVTLRVYAHVIHSAEAEAADVFARVIRAQQTSAVSRSVSKKPRRRTGRGR